MSGAMGEVKAWLPRSLLHLPPGTPIPSVRADGLTAMRLRWEAGRLRRPEPLPATEPAPSLLVLPRSVDPHVHLDKAFTWDRHPNLANFPRRQWMIGIIAGLGRQIESDR